MPEFKPLGVYQRYSEMEPSKHDVHVCVCVCMYACVCVCVYFKEEWQQCQEVEETYCLRLGASTLHSSCVSFVVATKAGAVVVTWESL